MTATASRSQQPSADAMQEAQNCAICMDADASRPSRVKGCDHLFWCVSSRWQIRALETYG